MYEGLLLNFMQKPAQRITQLKKESGSVPKF